MGDIRNFLHPKQKCHLCWSHFKFTPFTAIRHSYSISQVYSSLILLGDYFKLFLPSTCKLTFSWWVCFHLAEKKKNPKKFSTNSHYDTWGTLRVYTLPSSCYRMMGLWSEQRTLHLFVHQIPFFLIYSKTSPQHFSSLLSAFPSLLDHSHQQTNIYKFFIKKYPILLPYSPLATAPLYFLPFTENFLLKSCLYLHSSYFLFYSMQLS